ncbi:hypothetical protein GALMADRAFT_1250433 [Galerina marginata CBS 339.88]|uniref:F-box domain-containing protein n=1 Tax=Galerina marginata (strain CBS 339.88) TaxID=685588 RepID=A0A067T801_GALM3|nr:hypothetical protein GALMADRAFT_1250433 [Galerina marginata CBS 339.88]
MSFTYVCSWWRAVALGVPELWVAVCVGPERSGMTTPGVMRVWMDHVEGVLEKQTREEEAGRKGMKLDLHLAVLCDEEAQYAEIEYIRKTIPIFCDKLPIARSLHLVLDKHALSEWGIHLFRALSPSLTPNLTPAPSPSYLEDIELMFTTSASPLILEISDLISWLSTLPSIRCLKWHYTPTQLFPQCITALPWRRLTEATITSPISFDEARTCLASCVSATTLEFFNMGWPVPWPDELRSLARKHGATTLPNLTSLALGDSGSPVMLLFYFSLPALKRLWLRKAKQLETRQHSYFPGLRKFFERSGCMLERLTIKDTTLGIGIGWTRPPPGAREEVGRLLWFAASAGVGELDLVFWDAWAKVEELFVPRQTQSQSQSQEEMQTQQRTPDVLDTFLRSRTLMAWNPRTTTKDTTQAVDVEEHVGWFELQEGDDRELQYTIEGGLLHRCQQG